MGMFKCEAHNSLLNNDFARIVSSCSFSEKSAQTIET